MLVGLSKLLYALLLVMLAAGVGFNVDVGFRLNTLQAPWKLFTVINYTSFLLVATGSLFRPYFNQTFLVLLLPPASDFIGRHIVEKIHLTRIPDGNSAIEDSKKLSRCKRPRKTNGPLYYLRHLRSCAISNQSQCSASTQMGRCSTEISDDTDKIVERIHANFMCALHDRVNETCAGKSYCCEMDDERFTQWRAKQELKEGDDKLACLTHEPSMGGVVAGVKRPNSSPEGGNRRRQRRHQEEPAEAPAAATSAHQQEPLLDYAAACSSGVAARSSGAALVADQGDGHNAAGCSDVAACSRSVVLVSDPGDGHSATACSSCSAAHSSGVAFASDQGEAYSAAACSSGAAARSSGVALASDQGDDHSATACSSGAAARSSGVALASDQGDDHTAA
jgi:hypothetical protein